MSRMYLEHIKMDAFGAFSNRAIGPFSPHLNVVFGPNEAGKTTLSKFVGGVLFGWEDARASRNTYRPSNAERAGSLFFAQEGALDGAGCTAELSRARNADGLRGDAELIEDLDKETFRTMFSLDSDELRQLRNTTDVTAKLLTAGSGTGASPAHALAKVQDDIASFTSRAASAHHSLTNIDAACDELRKRIAAAADETERLKLENQELSELSSQRRELTERIARLNREVEGLSSAADELGGIRKEIASLEEQISDFRESEEKERRKHRASLREHAADLSGISATEESGMRDRIEALAAQEAKLTHAVDLANENFASSKAAYEALEEAGDAEAESLRAKRQQRVQVALSVALPVAFMMIGIPLFMHGRDISSLSFTALGFGLVAVAVILAFAALVLLFRPNKPTGMHEARLRDAHWVMLQDNKKLEACVAARADFSAQIADELASMGLSAAGSSLRRARLLLDEAKDMRTETALYQQRRQAIVSGRTSCEQKLAAKQARRDELVGMMSAGGEGPEAVNALLDQRIRQRDELLEQSERLSQRFGELQQKLDTARSARSFDELKLRYQELQTRRADSAMRLAELLLARRILETSIAAWESKSQPEVYRKASELLSMMTEGAWVKVSMSSEGRLQVTDALRSTREPVHLSLGTCQQLYLSLRIALLITADNVGRSVPILADDILVNFDSRRRAGAARALAELARSRQVIVMTCHEEIVETMRCADAQLNVVRL